jgi:hypothetical protein
LRVGPADGKNEPRRTQAFEITSSMLANGARAKTYLIRKKKKIRVEG